MAAEVKTTQLAIGCARIAREMSFSLGSHQPHPELSLATMAPVVEEVGKLPIDAKETFISEFSRGIHAFLANTQH